MPPPKPNKLAFLTQTAPASYVAGLGRGASGFTTRSDIGPAREGPSADDKKEEEPMDSEAYQDPDNETGLFAGMVYEADDEEADRIYDSVDRKMDERRRARREANEQAALSKTRALQPKLQTQFADLKRGLADVTDAEWEGLPEVGNLTANKRRKGNKNERLYAVPDSVIAGDRDRGAVVNTLQDDGGEGGSADGTLSNLVEIGQARGGLLSLKLDQMSDPSSQSGTSTSIDPKGYLTSLSSLQTTLKTDAEIGDIKKARMLFDSLVKSNPKHAPGWIAAACVEEHAGRMVAARKIIMEGCRRCSLNEDVWLEAARLHNNDDAKVILANAVQSVDKSVKIWLAAAELEHELKAKKRVLRKALEQIPNSVTLWKQTISLESEPEDALILLSRAVEVLPHSVELWLALARLETPENAKKVLNKARKAVPTSHEIWIAAARLVEQSASDQSRSEEEREKDLILVGRTIELGVKELRKHRVLLTREQWLDEAMKCEEEGSPRTAEAIVNATIAMDVEEEDREPTWVGDAEAALAKGRVGTARAILAYALKVFPGERSLWRRAADLEKAFGTRSSVEAILSRATTYCPQAEVLWLMLAKEKWITGGDVPGARDVLEQAFLANPESESIWLAAVKLEAENGEWDVARQLLERARRVADTERIWMKSAVFERQQGHLESALQTVNTALTKFQTFAKLHMIKGQILTLAKDLPAARAAYAAGVKACPKSTPLWVLSSRLEEQDGRVIKARSILEKARMQCPKDEVLWAETVKMEERAGNAAQASAMLSRGVQECPASGLLYSLSLWFHPKPVRKSRGADALKKTRDHPLVICAVACVFWEDGSYEKARTWFGRAVQAEGGKDVGDIWASWWKFETAVGAKGGGQGQQGKERVDEVVRRCEEAEPKHGWHWAEVVKTWDWPDGEGGTGKRGKRETREVLKEVASRLRDIL